MIMARKDSPRLLEYFFSSNALVFLAFFLVCLLSYANSFQNQFMMDDHAILLGRHGMLDRSFIGIFQHNQGSSFYRPIGHIPLWIFSRLFRFNFIGYHAANLFLFAGIVFFFYAIVRKLTAQAPLSFFSAVLYAIHPLNGMLVNYITASVIAVFVLSMQASFWYFLRFSEQGRRGDYILCFIFFIFASLSHEMAIMLPVYLAAYLFFIKRESWWNGVRFLSPFVLFFGAWTAIRFKDHIFHNRVSGPFEAMGNVAAHFSTWMDLVSWYVSKLFFPDKILFLWSSPYGSEHLLRDLIFFVLATGLAVYALLKWKRSWQSFFLATFVVGLLPTVFSCFLDFPGTWPIIEPHWFYFSEVGFFILLAGLILTMARKSPVIGGIFGGCVILLFLVHSWDYNTKWKSQEIYSRYWLSLNKGNWTPYSTLGESLMDKGDYQGAFACFSKLIGLNYNPAYVDNNLGVIYLKQGQWEKAEGLFRQALAYNPLMPEPRRGLATISLNHADYQKAIDLCLINLGIVHDDADTLFLLLDIYLQKKDFVHIKKYAYRMISFETDPALLTKLGVGMAQNNEPEIAMDSFIKAIRVAVDYKDAYFAAGTLLANLGKYDEAIHIWKMGRGTDPSDQRFEKDIAKAMELKLKNQQGI